MASRWVFTVSVVILLLLRLGGLALSCAFLYYLAYIAKTWHHNFGVAISCATIAIVVDLAAIGILFAARCKLMPSHTGWTIVGAIIVIVLGGIWIMELINNSMHYSDAPTGYSRPWLHMEDVAFLLVICVMVVRFLFMVLECVSCCVSHSRKKKQQRKAEEEDHELAAKSVVSKD